MRLKKDSVVVLFTFYLCVLISNGFHLDEENAHIFKGKDGSYFGFSVGFIKNKEKSADKWIMVGAPRSQDSLQAGVEKPGVLHNCFFENSSPKCKEVNVNGNQLGNVKNEDAQGITVNNDKNNGWLGGSLDIGEFIFTCAPRWKNDVSSDKLYMNGLCYEISSSLEFPKKYASLSEPGKQTSGTDDEVLVYAQGAMGMSARYTPDGRETIIGAPGLMDSAGGFVFINQDGDSSVHTVTENPNKTASYYGYALEVGDFFGTGNLYAVGGPRDGITGKVKIVDNNYNTVAVLEGHQIGSYFGGSLCATDIIPKAANTDNTDFLLVGAPLFSETGSDGRFSDLEVGKVYVYKANAEKNNMVLVQTLNGSSSPHSRFGAAVAALSDINSDNYKDVAVGAPFEDSGHGVVYVYNGYHGGIWPKYTQRIQGRKINNELMTFGAAISSPRKPFFYNDDLYSDTLIGAYESDRVVLLYANPPITMRVSLKFNKPKVLEEDTKTFNFQVCFEYKGLDLPPDVWVNYTVQLDSSQSKQGRRERIVLEDGKTMVTGQRKILRDIEGCSEPYNVNVISARDKFSGLNFETTYNVFSESSAPCIDNICPKVNTFDGKLENPDQATIKEERQFKREGCGVDNVCNTDLSVQASASFPQGNAVLIGPNSRFSIDIRARNNGPEWAYGVVIRIQLPANPDIEFVKLEGLSSGFSISCYPSSQTVLTCGVEEPMKTGESIHYKVLFDSSRIVSVIPAMTVKVLGSMISSDPDQENNKPELSISVRSGANIVFSGVSNPDFYVTKEETEAKFVVHKYDFENPGPSPLISETRFTVRYPYIQLNREQLFVLKSFVLASGQSSSTSSVRCWRGSNSQIDLRYKASVDKGVTYYDFILGNATLASENVLHQSCVSDPCEMVTCGVSPVPVGVAVSITLTFSMKPSTFPKIQNANTDKTLEEVSIVSKVTATLPSTQSLITDTQYDRMAKISLLPSKPVSKKLAWWIILLAVLGGVALLALLLVLLWKCGFFKRKKIPDNAKSSEPGKKYADEELEVLNKPEKEAEPAGDDVPANDPPPSLSTFQAVKPSNGTEDKSNLLENENIDYDNVNEKKSDP